MVQLLIILFFFTFYESFFLLIFRCFLFHNFSFFFNRSCTRLKRLVNVRDSRRSSNIKMSRSGIWKHSHHFVSACFTCIIYYVCDRFYTMVDVRWITRKTEKSQRSIHVGAYWYVSFSWSFFNHTDNRYIVSRRTRITIQI